MDWQYFWIHIGGDALAIVVLGSLVKILLDKHFKKQELTFSDKLNTEQEKLKAELNKTLSAFNNRHSIFCERQEAAFAEVYARLWKCYYSFRPLRLAASDEDFENQYDAYRKLHEEAAQYFGSKPFYFTNELITIVAELLSELHNVPVFAMRLRSLGKDNPEHTTTIFELQRTTEKVTELFNSLRQRLHKTISGT